MDSNINTHRLSRDEWDEAVGAALNRRAESHAINAVKARKFIPALADMIAECGVSGIIIALASATRRAAKDRALFDDDGGHLITEKNAGRISRFAWTLRFRSAADEVRDSLAADVEDDAGEYPPASEFWQEIGRQLAAEAAERRSKREAA
jgi:hypothetical protein